VICITVSVRQNGDITAPSSKEHPMSNVNAEPKTADPKPSYCELNEEALDIVAGGSLGYVLSGTSRLNLDRILSGPQPNSVS
jgi:hypothetical protein